MPELLLAALAGVGIYKGYKWVSGKMNSAKKVVYSASNAAGFAKVSLKNMPKLKRDPNSGIYRVKK